MLNPVKKDQIFTVPNLLSIVRLTLIPIIIWVYIYLQDYQLAGLLNLRRERLRKSPSRAWGNS